MTFTASSPAGPIKFVHSLAIESQFHSKSFTMTSGGKSVRILRGAKEGCFGPWPVACLGDGAANARETKETRARSLDIIIWGQREWFGIKSKRETERVAVKGRMWCAHVFIPSLEPRPSGCS
jgi:hypothetical protein